MDFFRHFCCHRRFQGKVSGLKAGTVKITATAGTNKKSDSITITITGVKPEVSNVIYATKPSGWSKIYAYVYNAHHVQEQWQLAGR